jgi:hypothetical protein
MKPPVPVHRIYRAGKEAFTSLEVALEESEGVLDLRGTHDHK